MRIRWLWLLGATGVLSVFVGVLLAIPALASPSAQEGSPGPDPLTSMHEACEAGDAQGMTEGMDGLNDEEWQGMGEHMDDGHHGDMGEHMSDGHNGAAGSGMMGGSMMGGRSGQGMMGW